MAWTPFPATSTGPLAQGIHLREPYTLNTLPVVLAKLWVILSDASVVTCYREQLGILANTAMGFIGYMISPAVRAGRIAWLYIDKPATLAVFALAKKFMPGGHITLPRCLHTAHLYNAAYGLRPVRGPLPAHMSVFRFAGPIVPPSSSVRTHFPRTFAEVVASPSPSRPQPTQPTQPAPTTTPTPSSQSPSKTRTTGRPPLHPFRSRSRSRSWSLPSPNVSQTQTL
jgi:hypothetical protein